MFDVGGGFKEPCRHNTIPIEESSIGEINRGYEGLLSLGWQSMGRYNGGDDRLLLVIALDIQGIHKCFYTGALCYLEEEGDILEQPILWKEA